MKSCNVARIACWLGAISLWCSSVPARAEGESHLYRCPGDLYTNSLSAKEAQEKGCRTLEGAPITIIAPAKRAGAAAVPSRQPSDNRIDPALQKARDSDARRILEAELRREETRLAELRKEYNAGEPERRGDERNYQKYLDRTAELKASIARKENDVAAIKRELAKVAP
jgi:hypothetical protein